MHSKSKKIRINRSDNWLKIGIVDFCEIPARLEKSYDPLRVAQKVVVGRESSSGDARNERPLTSASPETVRKCRELEDQNHCLTMNNLSQALDSLIPRGQSQDEKSFKRLDKVKIGYILH